MNGEIVGIGTEILLGEILDTNSQYIARQLRDIGINVFYITAVGDNLGRITNTIKQGLERSDIIITTGGLGPTVDDVTRQGVAAAIGHDLVFHQHLLDMIAERFKKFGSPMTENNRQQAMIPEGAMIVENPVGTAPCYIVESEQGTVISLPGVPREMKYLMEHAILPYLKKRTGSGQIIKARILRTAGIGESSLDDKIGQFMNGSNPTVGLAAHGGQTDIRITARATTEAEADAMIADMEKQIRAEVEYYIFGVDKENLEDVVFAMIQAEKAKIVLLEAGTDGILTGRFKGEDIIKNIDQHNTLADLQAAYGLKDLSLVDLAKESIRVYCEQQAVPFGLSILYNGDMLALAVYEPGHIMAREVNLGDEKEIIYWAIHRGLGRIWHYLKKKNQK